MKLIQKHRALALGLHLLAGLACNVGTTLDVWEGAHVRVESSPWLQFCGGTHERLDDFVPFMTAQLGLAVPPVQTYRWLESYDFLTSGCSEGTIGCALGTLAVSQEPFLPHELVHTSLALLNRPYQPFFGERIAEALDPWAGDGVGPIYLGRIIGREEFGDPRPSSSRPAPISCASGPCPTNRRASTLC